MKRVFIKTYGCQMNVYDSTRMLDALKGEGYSETSEVESADLVLLNTCHIREKAAEKVYSDVGRFNMIKRAKAEEGKELIIGVAGCVAQAEGEEILRRAPAVDLVFGPQSYHRLPDLLKRQREKGRALETEFPPEDKFEHLPLANNKDMLARGVSSFLTVQEGCDKFCTFCVVPYTRGAEVSRPVLQILEEARRMAEAGVREVTLLGQNVNGYHGLGPDGAQWSLGKLLFALAEIKGLDRLRYITSHPRDMHDELYAAHRDLPQVMPFLHLPVQAGSDKILKAMNRQHTAADYLKILERMRQIRPDIALSSDFIVGFPGESEEDFQATLNLVREVNYAICYSFKYSPRPGTPAATEEGQVPEDVKTERLYRLQEILEQQQKDFAKAMVGKKLSVLLERAGKHEGQLQGRTPYLQPIQTQAPLSMIGQIVDIEVEENGTYSLFGRIANQASYQLAEGIA